MHHVRCALSNVAAFRVVTLDFLPIRRLQRLQWQHMSLDPQSNSLGPGESLNSSPSIELSPPTIPDSTKRQRVLIMYSHSIDMYGPHL
jgi:hypothetical protein